MDWARVPRVTGFQGEISHAPHHTSLVTIVGELSCNEDTTVTWGCKMIRITTTQARSRCFAGKQLVDGKPCFFGDALQEFHRGRVNAPNDVADSGLAYPKPPRQRRLCRTRSLQPGVQCLHDRQDIGLTYNSAIGSSYTPFPQNWDMAKPNTRSFLDRALEALAERHPKEKATQVRLARVAGVSQPAVHEWGLPNRAPAHGVVLKLAHELNVCVEWLYTERGDKRPKVTPDAEQFLKDFSQLDSDSRRQLARYVEFLKGSTDRQ